MNKQKCYAWVLGFATTISITACHEDIGISGGGSVGKIAPHIELNTTVESSKKSASRAETGITANDLALKITAEDGSYSGSWNSLSDFPSDNTFSVGNYLVEALYGSVETEGFESPAYYGSQNITVHEDETTDVSLTATLANTMLSVDYTDAFKNYMTSWSAEAHSAGGEYIYFTQDETRPAYMRPGTVTLNVEFTKPNGTSAKLQVAQFNGVARHHYHMTVDIENGAGDAVLKVIYDDALDTETVEIDLSDELLNAPAPEITGEGMVNGSLISHFEGDEITQSLKANIVARGTIAGATLTTQSTDLLAAGWPAEIDLVAATSEQQATLKSLGLNVVGLYKNPEKMALIDFTQVLNHTYNAVFTLEVRDVYGKVSDAFSFSIKVEEMQLAIVSANKLGYYADELTFKLQYNGSNKQAIKVKYINELGLYQDATITNIADTDTSGVYDVTFTTGTSLSSVQFYATVAGKQTAAYTVQRADIPVTVAAADVDVYATKATVTGTINDTDEVSSPKLAYRVKGASSWTEATTTESGTALSASLTGLSDNTTYELAAINSGKVVSAIKTFTTEEAAQLPNSDMEDWYTNASGSNYSEMYLGTSTNTVWGTNNPMTTSQGSDFAYCRISGTVSTTDAHNGTAALLRTIGWGSGNTASGYVSTGVCKYVDAGLLHLGASRSARPEGYGDGNTAGAITTTDLTTGMTFASRPISLNFWYKYTPKNSSDHGVAEVYLYDASGNIIATGAADLGKATAYTETTISLTYSSNAKAAKIYVKFLSTYSESFLTKSSSNLSAPSFGNLSDGKYLGSQLYLDDLSLNY